MELILFPFSGNAKEAISVIEEINRMNPTWKIIWFIDDYTLVGSNVSISGGVHIESLCYIGTGSKIMQELRIGRGSLIGMGTNVLKSIEPNSVVVGNPGRIIRKVQ